MRQRKSRTINNATSASQLLSQAGRDVVCCEPLESRLLLSAAGPSVERVTADNRGQVVIQFDERMNFDTLNADSIRLYTAGADFLLGTADDVQIGLQFDNSLGARFIGFTGEIPAGQRYRVVLDGSMILDENNRFLDGEFNGNGVLSGDGVQGGNFEFFTRRAATSIVRFTTRFGNIDVELFDDRPITVANFLAYANGEDWDNTFFHRSAQLTGGDPFVLQGGGFNADPALSTIPSRGNIRNEPGRSNTRGTIAMAKVGGNPNSASNQWFFNMGDNSENLDNQNGGFTVFGQITDDAGLAVIDAIAALDRFNASSQGSAFNEVPVVDEDLIENGQVRPEDLVVISRIALLVDITNEASGQIADDDAQIFTNDNGTVRVMFYDLSGNGLADVSDSVVIKFGRNDTIKSITIKGELNGDLVGLRIDGADHVGSIKDNRVGASNLAFIMSDSSVGSITTKSNLTGYNLNDFVLSNGFVFDEDVDSDGDFDDNLAVFVEDGLMSKLQLKGSLAGDVVASGGIKSVQVTGFMTNSDLVIGNQGLLRPTTTKLKLYRVDNGGVRSSLPITSITAIEWTNTGEDANTIQAPTLNSLKISGDKRAGILGDLGAGLVLSQDVEGVTTLGSVTIAGSITTGTWDVAGETGSISVGEDIFTADMTFGAAVRSITAQSVLFSDIDVDGELNAITIEEWNGGELAADSFGNINVTGDSRESINGDFFGDLTIRAGAGNLAVRSIKINGNVGNGTWTATGEVDKILIQGDATDWVVDINGNLNIIQVGVVTNSRIDVSLTANTIEFISWTGGAGLTGRTMIDVICSGDSRRGDAGDYLAPITLDGLGRLSINGDLVGNITLRATNDIIIGGDVRDSVIKLTQTPSVFQEIFALQNLTIGGVMDNSEFRSTASVGNISVTAMFGSGLYVGAPATQFGLPDSATGMNLDVGISSVSVNGLGNNEVSFQNSFIVAGKLGAVKVQIPETNNGGSPFGIAAGSIASISTRFGPPIGRQQANNPIATLPPIGDYQVRVNFNPPA